ncbi:hypothetical protein [Halalkalibacter sp. APA_J-10(15)]|uniref:hypothetical protein n=1 Tax=Halalkalibacter sp. APA_J-10(15) TaxID=2933805 RepID=UPI001FF221AF|nr:hypothetical protein [Halalkalibacter sp. APA_J-10(15)]MCK0472683.1 hypothetical protein [Halalkalibacter sp. APA_J-10(15)]
MSFEHAQEESYRVQLEELAILTRANEVGIRVSEEEAQVVINQTKEAIESKNVDNWQETKESIDEQIQELGISEEEYWNEFLIEPYQQTLMRQYLMEYVQKKYPKMSWNERREQLIEQFKQREAEQIAEFKEEAGL